MKSLFILGLIAGMTACESSKSAKISDPWKKHIILATNDAAEGQASSVNTAVANDFDQDGDVDVMASYNGKVFLYKAPDWKTYVIVDDMPINPSTLGELRGCIHSTLMDVDGDGDLDFVGSNRMIFWLECPPKPFEQPWKLRMITYEVNGAHCLITGDVDRDGKLELIANSWRDSSQSKIPDSITFLRIPENPLDGDLWKPIVFSDRDAPKRNHYMGFGDVNKDGRPDIACAGVGDEGSGNGWFAWWEQPVNPDGPWKKHLLSDKEESATNILIADLNGDGHEDFVGSRGHGKGIVWFKGPEFQKIDIDRKIESPHSLAVADLDADGDLDIASCGAKPDGEAVIHINDGNCNFTRHLIGQNQGSYDIRLVDMDGDADADMLVAGHTSRNIVWFENPMK